MPDCHMELGATIADSTDTDFSLSQKVLLDGTGREGFSVWRIVLVKETGHVDDLTSQS